MKRFTILFIMAQFAWLTTLTATESGLTRNTRTDTLAIGLQEAILQALERNPAVSIQRLDPEIAKTYTGEAGAAFDPQLAITTSNSETKQQRFLGSRPDPFELTTKRSQYDVGISETLPTGTTVLANASISGTLSSIYSDQYTGSVGLTVTQSLLQGFGTGYNMASLRKARLDVDISILELKAVAEQVTADVERAYWDLFLAEQEMAIQQKSLDLAGQQLDESRERVAVGRLPELELAAVLAEVASRREALIDAQSRYEQARLYFLFLLNPAQANPWELCLVPVDQPFIPLDTLDSVPVHEQLARKYRADLQQAQLNLQKNKLDLVRTRNGLLPRLDLFINLGRTTYAKSFKESIPDVQSPFYDATAGISFELPLRNREARAQYSRTQFTHDQMELSLLNMERLVQRDVRSAHIEVLRARQQIEATQVARDLQEKKFLAEQEKFRVGKSTNFLVLQTQRDFVAGQLGEARAKVAYLNALVDLYLMEGTLLERRGIRSFSARP